jgi:hypothetical protein
MSTVDAKFVAIDGGLPGLRPFRRAASIAVLLLVSFGPAAAAQDGAAAPLEAAIDAIVDSNAVGPLAPVCSDADFLRRVSIDLVGAIPPVDRVRAFLADPSPDKRARLIDELLAAPAHARHYALLLDGMLLERKVPAADMTAAWREFLITAIAADRPLDQVCGDCLASDGADPATRPAAAFFFAREAEPVQMTRSIGRIFFGRDLQCAQCHDHPNNADIHQADYYGLNAFLARTTLFRAEGDPKPFLGEKADGEVEYTSVFTKEGQKGVRPRVPFGATLAIEPLPESADQYTTAPAKNVRGVPLHSRRRALARMLADSVEFRRTMANRLWATMNGRGLVHPLDGLDPDNAPTHPDLLTLLAESLRANGFHLRPLLRGIALSRTYQRSIEPPAISAEALAGVPSLIDQLTALRVQQEGAIAPLEAAAKESEARFAALLARDGAVLGELPPLVEARNTARAAADAAIAAKKAAEEELAKKVAQAESLASAAAKAGEAAALLADDKVLAGAAAIVAARSAEFAASVETAKAAVAAKTTEHDAAQATLVAARQACDGVLAKRPVADAIVAADQAAISARSARQEAGFAVARTDLRLGLARDLLRHGDLAATDPAAAAVLHASIVDRWTTLGQMARLRPLSPEQLAFSLLTASGSMQQFHAAAEAKVEKEPPEVLKTAAPEAAPAIRVVQVEVQTIQQVAGYLATVAGLYSDPLATDFQTSVNQALWIGNSPDVAGTLRPGGENLAARLVALADDGAVADEAFLTVFSRHPGADEKADVAAALAGRADDRAVAIAELLWAMLSSNEFRFNH